MHLLYKKLILNLFKKKNSKKISIKEWCEPEQCILLIEIRTLIFFSFYCSFLSISKCLQYTHNVVLEFDTAMVELEYYKTTMEQRRSRTSKQQKNIFFLFILLRQNNGHQQQKTKYTTDYTTQYTTNIKTRTRQKQKKNIVIF